jgi:hypothetical protein
MHTIQIIQVPKLETNIFKFPLRHTSMLEQRFKDASAA